MLGSKILSYSLQFPHLSEFVLLQVILTDCASIGANNTSEHASMPKNSAEVLLLAIDCIKIIEIILW